MAKKAKKPGSPALSPARLGSTTRAARVKQTPARAPAVPVKLLSGDNPQIAKGEGDAPVQAYITAAPGWKGDVARRLDAIITRDVPHVRKAVKWNSPFYGAGLEDWFVSFHFYTKFVRVAFFRGAALKPPPPGASKLENVRYLDIREGALDETQFAKWVRQASRLPGVMR